MNGMENIVSIKEIIPNLKMVCPFRMKTITTQAQMEMTQVEEYPECQYALCPFYNEKGKTNYEKCRHIDFSSSGYGI